MSEHGRTLVSLLAIAGVIWISAPAEAQTESAVTPVVIHACYVPLTGTVYRIKEPGLRSACASTSHIEFQWEDGAGALRPSDAEKGDLLQFDGKQWRPIRAQSVGGVTGYEVATLTATNSYPSQPGLEILSTSADPAGCNGSPFCFSVVYRYHLVAAPTTVTLSCPAGKKAFGVFAAGDVSTDILADGSVGVTTPSRERTTPTQTGDAKVVDLTLDYSQLTNQYPLSTTPDNFPVKVICANAG